MSIVDTNKFLFWTNEIIDAGDHITDPICSWQVAFGFNFKCGVRAIDKQYLIDCARHHSGYWLLLLYEFAPHAYASCFIF